MCNAGTIGRAGNGMIHRLFTLASAASLLIWLASAVIWAQSYRYWDEIRFGRFDRDAVSYSAIDFNRQLRLARIRNDWGVAGQRDWGWAGAAYPPRWRATPDATPWNWGGTRLGFTAGFVSYRPARPGVSGRRGFSGSALIVGIPPWFACAAAAILPLCWLARRRLRPTPGPATGTGTVSDLL